MEINRLLSDELTYELHIRGAPFEGTVLEKRQRLRGLLKLEKLGTAVYKSLDSQSIVMEDEVEICTRKVAELDSAIKSFDVQNAANEHQRIQSRLLHVVGRLSRLPDGCEERSTLLSRGSELLGSLDELGSQQTSAAPQAANPSQGAISGQLLDEPNPLLSHHILDEPNTLLPMVVHSAARSRGLDAGADDPNDDDGDLLGDPVLPVPCSSRHFVGGVEDAPPRLIPVDGRLIILDGQRQT